MLLLFYSLVTSTAPRHNCTANANPIAQYTRVTMMIDIAWLTEDGNKLAISVFLVES